MVGASFLSSLVVEGKQGAIYSDLFFVYPDLACLVLTLNFLAMLKDRALWKELFRHCCCPGMARGASSP